MRFKLFVHAHRLLPILKLQETTIDLTFEENFVIFRFINSFNGYVIALVTMRPRRKPNDFGQTYLCNQNGSISVLDSKVF